MSANATLALEGTSYVISAARQQSKDLSDRLLRLKIELSLESFYSFNLRAFETEQLNALKIS